MNGSVVICTLSGSKCANYLLITLSQNVKQPFDVSADRFYIASVNQMRFVSKCDVDITVNAFSVKYCFAS